MKIKVLFFAKLKEIFGESYRVMDIPEGSCVNEVVDRLAGESAGFALKEIPLVFAVNEDFESGSKMLADQDHLAIMTPMAGG